MRISLGSIFLGAIVATLTACSGGGGGGSDSCFNLQCKHQRFEHYDDKQQCCAGVCQPCIDDLGE